MHLLSQPTIMFYFFYAEKDCVIVIWRCEADDWKARWPISLAGMYTPIQVLIVRAGIEPVRLCFPLLLSLRPWLVKMPNSKVRF